MMSVMRSATDVALPALGSLPPLDPRIMFALVTPEPMTGASIFQGFSPENLALSWVYGCISRLPASLFEPTADWPLLMGARICGMASWRIIPMRLPFLRMQGPSPHSPLWVVFSADHAVARGISEWQRQLALKPLHVSVQRVEGAIGMDDISVERMRDHLMAQIDANPHAGLEPLRRVVEQWRERERRSNDFEIKGHFALSPNHMTLQANGVDGGAQVPDWKGETPQAYREAIAESVAQVEALRAEAVITDSVRLTPPRPDLWLISPSWFEDIKRRIALTGAVQESDKRAVEDVVRRIERQRDFAQPMTEDQVARFEASALARQLHDTRKEETKLFAFAIGLAAAGTLAATWRMQPAVNLVRGRVRQLSENIRAEARTPAHKIAKLFHEVQAALSDAVGPDAIAAARNTQWGVKIVSDAPLEWLPIDDLPLGLHMDVSRLSATPGDVLLRQLTRHEPIRLAISDFADVLVVSAIAAGDRLDLIHKALAELEPNYAERLNVRFVRVTTEQEFVEAINDFKGPLMIFDGHGSHPHDGLGHLLVGDDQVDFWRLRGRVRLPPIVVLSACDTQAAARSSASVANGLLHLGARTVLATLLPIGGFEGAAMVGRLITRLAGFLPIASRSLGRVVMWSEVIGGMLRMQFLFDLLIPLERDGRLTLEQFREILAPASLLSHRDGASGLESVERALAERGIMEPAAFRAMVRRAVPLSDTIRYTQMGHPETILIGSVTDLPLEDQAAFEAIAEHLAPTWSGDDWSPDIAVDLGELLSRMPLTPEGEIVGLERSRDRLSR